MPLDSVVATMPQEEVGCTDPHSVHTIEGADFCILAKNAESRIFLQPRQNQNGVTLVIK